MGTLSVAAFRRVKSVFNSIMFVNVRCNLLDVTSLSGVNEVRR